MDYRSMQTGIHGLILFDTRNKAEKEINKCMKTLKSIEIAQNLGKLNEDEFTMEYMSALNRLIEESVETIEEIDYHDIKESSVNGRKCFLYGDNCIIVNYPSVDLYYI